MSIGEALIWSAALAATGFFLPVGASGAVFLLVLWAGVVTARTVIRRRHEHLARSVGAVAIMDGAG